jgi:hypothetical protein
MEMPRLSGISRRLSVHLPGILAAVLTLFVYERTMTPGIAADDAGELQFTSWALGVAHGSGYPLFIWLGKLFTFLPIGNIARRVTTLSAVSGAASVFMVYEVARLFSDRGWTARLAAATAAVGFGLTYTFWFAAVITEMYTLHVFLALLVVWLALRWQQSEDFRLLCAAALVYGLMFGNHLCALSVGPPLALFALVTQPKRWLNLRTFGAVFGCFVAGVLFGNVFLFWLLWLKHQPLDQYHVVTRANRDLYSAPEMDSFWWAYWFTVTTRQFQGWMHPEHSWRMLELRAFPHRFVAQFFPVGAFLGAAGWSVLWWRNWRAQVLLTGICLTQLFLNLQYQNWKIVYYFVGPYACFAVFIALGLDLIGRGVEGALRRVKFPEPWGRIVLMAIVVIVFSGLFAANAKLAPPYADWLARRHKEIHEIVHEALGKRPDQSHDDQAYQTALSMLDSIPDDALVYASWWLLYPILYASRIERHHPAIDALEAYPAPSGWGFSPRKKQFILDEIKKRPVYLADQPGGAAGPYKLVPVKPGLWRFE